MRPFALLAFLVAVILSACGGWLCYRNSSAVGGRPLPRSWSADAFESKDHDFGDVPEGPELVWDFRYVNHSDQAIQVKSTHASCGCIVVTAEPETCSPGGSGSIRVVLQTMGVKPPARIAKSIEVLFDGDVAPVRLVVAANVQPPVTVVPAVITFLPGASWTSQVIIRRERLDIAEFRAVELRCDESIYKAELLSRDSQDACYSVQLRDAPGTRELEPLQVFLRPSAQVPAIIVPCRQEGAIVLPRAYLIVIDGSHDSITGEESKQRFRVSCPGADHVEVKECELFGASAARFVSCAKDDEQADSVFVWLKEVPTRSLVAVLNVQYADADKPFVGTVSIPIHLVVARQGG
jgi:hypothetical protein